MILKIITEPNKILHQATQELIAADLKNPEIKQLISDMTETMYVKDGVGIAANQVGKSYKICVIAKQFTNDKKNDLILVNPNWEKTTLRKTIDTEGCLSVPNTYGEVKRYKKIKVKAMSENGEPLEFIAEDFFARIIQHEIDHLNGHLFIEKAKNIQYIEPGKNI